MIEKTGLSKPITPIRSSVATVTKDREKNPYDRRQAARDEKDNKGKPKKRGQHIDERC